MIRRSSSAYVPAIGPDEDEPIDPVELAGLDPAAGLEIFSANDPAICLKGTCWRPSDACDTCRHGRLALTMKVNSPDVLALMDKFAGCDFLPKQVEPEFGSRIMALSDEFLAVSTCRGARVRHELCISGRMGF